MPTHRLHCGAAPGAEIRTQEGRSRGSDTDYKLFLLLINQG